MRLIDLAEDKTRLNSVKDKDLTVRKKDVPRNQESCTVVPELTNATRETVMKKLHDDE